MQSAQHDQPQASPEQPTETTESAAVPPGLVDDLARLGRAIKELFGAQLSLLGAEWGLARSAVSLVLIMALVATVVGVGLGLTVLGLVGVALAQWFGSWIWALAALAIMQTLFLVLALWLFRKGMRWLSFPRSRQEWSAMARDTLRKARKRIGTEGDPPP